MAAAAPPPNIPSIKHTWLPTPAFRGRGLGHRFFDLRATHARDFGFRYSCFCAVVRPPDHPAKPPRYSPLDPFWRKRGYAPLNGAIVKFNCTDLGDTSETTKPLQLWLSAL